MKVARRSPRILRGPLVQRRVPRTLGKAEWDESLHPRGEGGRFGEGGSPSDGPRVVDVPASKPGGENHAAWVAIMTDEAKGLDDAKEYFPERYTGSRGYPDVHDQLKQGDERMNFGHEGTVASLSRTGGFYVAKTGEDYRIARIAFRDEDGWKSNTSDGYPKTDLKVPFERVDAVTPALKNPASQEEIDRHRAVFGDKAEPGLLRRTPRLLGKAEWNEDDHPRDHGKFTSAGGGDASPTPAAVAYAKLADLAAPPYAAPAWVSNPLGHVAPGGNDDERAAAVAAVLAASDVGQAMKDQSAMVFDPQDKPEELKAETASMLAGRMTSSTADMLAAVPRAGGAGALADAFDDPTVLIVMNAQGYISVQQSSEAPDDPAWGDVSSHMDSLVSYAEQRGDTYAKGGTPEAEQLAREFATRSLVSNWAASSNDQNATSLAIQRAAEEEFHLTGTAGWSYDSSTIQDRYEQSGTVYRDFLRAQYDETQSRLSSAGITELTLQRGFQFGGDDAPSPQWALALNTSGNWQHTGAVPMRPLSSWTTDPTTASNFASGAEARSVILTSVIPAERILSYPGSGVGSLEEQEFVALGGPVQGLGWAKTTQ